MAGLIQDKCRHVYTACTKNTCKDELKISDLDKCVSSQSALKHFTTYVFITDHQLITGCSGVFSIVNTIFGWLVCRCLDLHCLPAILFTWFVTIWRRDSRMLSRGFGISADFQMNGLTFSATSLNSWRHNYKKTRGLKTNRKNTKTITQC